MRPHHIERQLFEFAVCCPYIPGELGIIVSEATELGSSACGTIRFLNLEFATSHACTIYNLVIEHMWSVRNMCVPQAVIVYFCFREGGFSNDLAATHLNYFAYRSLHELWALVYDRLRASFCSSQYDCWAYESLYGSVSEKMKSGYIYIKL